MPDGWRVAVGQEDATFACNLVETTMNPYWARRQMRFSRAMFMQQWFKFDARVLDSDEVPAGIIAWNIDDNWAHLRELHLIQGMRGQGRGREVLEAWLALCRSKGARKVRLKVFAENPARNLYERVGFKVSREDSHITGLLTMERRL